MGYTWYTRNNIGWGEFAEKDMQVFSPEQLRDKLCDMVNHPDYHAKIQKDGWSYIMTVQRK